MADFTGSTTVRADRSAVFDLLSDVSNLPRYFARMTAAEPGEGEEVHTTAELPDGGTVEADAWFRVDEELRVLSWASEGSNDYRGSLELSEQPGGLRIAVHLHTTRVSDGDGEVQSGIDETLDAIVTLLEEEGVGSRLSPEERQAAAQREVGIDPDDRVDPEAAGQEAYEAADADQAEHDGNQPERAQPE